jgi:hypothetical protein
MSDLAIPRRYELKYALPESRVDAVREAILPYCALDRFCALRPERSYVIRTLYLDTFGRELYRRSREGRPRSVKVRVRTYGDEGTAPVFLELKRKEHGFILKTRGRIDAAWAERLHGPAATGAGPEEQAFRDQLARRALQPTLLVRYEREAWFSEVDEYARVTFDRRITCQAWPRWELGGSREAQVPIDDGPSLGGVPRGVLLELKCTLDFPRWMTALVQRLGLVRAGYSKYCTGVERIWGPAAAGPPGWAGLEHGVNDHE